MSLIEGFRSKVIKDIMEMPAMTRSWPHFRSYFARTLRSTSPSTADIFRLGDELSGAFRSNPIHADDDSTTASQEQSDASAGGSVWEGLVVWYFNICLAGTKSVAIKKRSHLPNFVREALKITISGGVSLTEPDVVVLTIDDSRLDNPLPNGRGSNPVTAFRTLVDDAVNKDATYKQKVKVINIQCKTNWNDSVQTPMLWNLLYASARALSGSSSSAVLPILRANSITFGENGNYIKDLGDYAYGFVTVPTNERGVDAYSSASTPVVRARSFTAGHYWGKPSRAHICTSVKEFFNNNTNLLSAHLNPGSGFSESRPNVDKDVFRFP
jgi:hypothetical protein